MYRLTLYEGPRRKVFDSMAIPQITFTVPNRFRSRFDRVFGASFDANQSTLVTGYMGHCFAVWLKQFAEKGRKRGKPSIFSREMEVMGMEKCHEYTIHEGASGDTFLRIV